jgi:hypothetical protein
MPISDRMRAALNAPQTDACPLVLLTLDHDALDGPLRVVNNNESVTSNGLEYLGYPFRVSLPLQDPERTASAQLTIDNVDPTYLAQLRGVTGRISATFELIEASLPDVVEMEFGEMVITSIDADAQTITGDLTMDDFFNEPYPGDTMNPGTTPGVFGV